MKIKNHNSYNECSKCGGKKDTRSKVCINCYCEIDHTNHLGNYIGGTPWNKGLIGIQSGINSPRWKGGYQAYLQRRQKKPNFKLNSRISCAIRRTLMRNKNNRKWESLVKYTANDLKKHLEKQFKGNMNWGNYGKGEGKWSIDHKIPISAFNFSKPDHIDFKRCWALSNLQPMWDKENTSKSNKLKQSFQPSLAF